MKRLLKALGILIVLAAACRSRPPKVILGIGLTTNAHFGVTLAAKEINDAGGIAGVPLELIGMDWNAVDSPYNPPTVLDWAQRFATQKDLLAVIGHNDSATTLTASAIYNRQRIPQIVTIATNPSITNIGAWTYRLCLSDSEQGPVLANYSVKEWGKHRIAVFFVNDDYGRVLARFYEKQARNLGAEIVASVMHRNTLQPDDQEHIKSVLANLKKNGQPDLIALFQRVPAANWTIRAAREAGLEADMLGCDNLAQQRFISENPKFAEGIRVSQFFNLESGEPQTKKFMQTYRAFAGVEPDYAQAFAYDAIYLMRDAIAAGGFTRDGVKSYLDLLIQKKIPIRGVGGPYILGPDHDARRSFYISEIREGRFRIIKALQVHLEEDPHSHK